MENYEINMDTLIILPYEKGKSRVIECKREIIVNCPYFGGVKAALTVFDNYAKVTVNDRVKLETQEACNWIIFNLTAGRSK